MKKIFTSLAVLALCSTAAFAQTVVSGVTFEALNQPADYEEGMPLASVNADIRICFQNYQEEEGYTPHLMIATGGGFEVGAEPQTLIPTPIVGTPDYACVLHMDKADWGNPYMGNFQATLMVYFEDAEGEFLLDEEYEPVMFMQSYMTKNLNTALVSVYPNGDWSQETFEKAYNRGEITFSFSGEVEFVNPNNIGTITYFIDDQTEQVEITDYVSEWSLLDGNWTISFNFQNEDFDAEDLTKVVITLTGVKSEETKEPVYVAPVVLDNTAAPQKSPRTKKALEEDLSANGLVNIYNVQGSLVKENANKSDIKDLPAGLYIVDGKKIIIR